MKIAAISPRSGRRLKAAGRARREAARRRRVSLAAGSALTLLFAAPISIAAFMGVESGFPGVATAKSFMAMMSERSPGDRTKGELLRTKQKAAPDAPTQRALGKITKPEAPKEFVEAIAPPITPITELPPVASKEALGPILLTPSTPGGGGGVIVPPQAPPGGGGGTPNQPPPGEPTPTDVEPPPPPPAVPEPGTWATMLIGFGFTGWALRRRRRKTTAALHFG